MDPVVEFFKLSFNALAEYVERETDPKAKKEEEKKSA